MRSGVFIPNLGIFYDPRRTATLAREAEEAGWEGFFLWDHILLNTPTAIPVADPWITLAAIATSTETIRLGPMLTPLARRRPWKVARETVTLDHLSGGRLVFGAGLGSPPDAEYGAFGEEEDARVRADKLDEGLAILNGLWSGRQFEHSGDHYAVGPTTFLPRPVQVPRVPVWIGGRWPNKRPFRRAARWDGVIPETVDGKTPSAADVKKIVAYVLKHRHDDIEFDVAVHGYTTPGHTGVVEDYLAAGATWWLERFDTSRGMGLDEVRKRVAAGPPTAELR